MHAGYFTSVTPVEDATVTEHDHIRLLDLNLIVIGVGEVAAELVRRRRLKGGRVCWLQTRRWPIPAGRQSDAGPAAPPSSGSLPSVSLSSSHRHIGVDGDLSGFSWRPPSSRQRRLETWSTRAFSTRHGAFAASRAGRTIGPEIAQLREEESYSVTHGGGDQAPAIQVVSSEQADSPVVWEVSGAVVFAGEQFSELKGVAEVCETVAAARALNVGVICQDAKPFAVVRPLHALMSAAVAFLQFLAFFVLMGTFEPHLEPGDLPWWRASFLGLTIVPFGFSAIADIFGPALTGAAVDHWFAAAMALLCAVVTVLACVLPVGWIGHNFCTLPLFVALTLAFTTYLLIGLPLLVLHKVRRCARQVAEAHRKIRWRAHVGWLLWILTGTFGTWMLMYVVAIFYVYLSSIRSVLSAIALPLMTSAVEFITVWGTIQAYKSFVLGTRLRRWGFTFLGDQRELLIVPICVTHAYAESTRLASVIVTTVKSPGFEWVLVLLVGCVQNILVRTENLTRLLTYVLPQRCWWMVALDAGTVLHNEVRLCFGYARFVPVLALGVANLGLTGFRGWPMFNFQATALVLASLLFEVVEDVIVTSGVLHCASWKAKLAPVYRGIGPLHPDLAMSFDKDGIQPGVPAMSFSGLRVLRLRTTFCIMHAACDFAYFLLTLLLGAGFVHGACNSWIAEEHRLTDGLVWRSPLRC